MGKNLLLNVDVINGEVQEKPVPFYFNTEKIKPIGEIVVRWFDFNMCSLATKVFSIEYEGETFGTRCFKTMADFWQWLGHSGSDNLLLNGCDMEIN